MTALPKSELRPILVGLGLAMLLSALDQTIVAAAMPSIAAQFADYEHLSWIVTAYLVAGVVATPLYGKLADIHGARVMMLIGVAIFAVGSLACALAPGMMWLAAARALQGLGRGALISLAQTLIAELVTPQERGRYQTYFSAVFVASSIAGPILGGLFSQYAHWSLIFWINLPLGAAAWLAVDRRLARLPVRSHPHKMDYPGAALLALASGALVLSLGRDGSGPSLPLIAVSLAAFLAFARRQRTAPEPMIPLSILTEPVIRDATISSSFGLGAFVGLSVTAPLYFQAIMALTASQSGLALIPIMAATVTGATVSGRTMAAARSYKTLPLAALALGAACAFAAALFLERLPLAALDALLTLVNLGVGAMLPVATVCVQNAAPRRDLGSATAVMQFCRQLACALIAALFGALVAHGGVGEGFRLVLAATGVCAALSFAFLARMEEKPLRGR